jgi:hypothetical protein
VGLEYSVVDLEYAAGVPHEKTEAQVCLVSEMKATGAVAETVKHVAAASAALGNVATAFAGVAAEMVEVAAA